MELLVEDAGRPLLADHRTVGACRRMVGRQNLVKGSLFDPLRFMRSGAPSTAYYSRAKASAMSPVVVMGPIVAMAWRSSANCVLSC